MESISFEATGKRQPDMDKNYIWSITRVMSYIDALVCMLRCEIDGSPKTVTKWMQSSDDKFMVLMLSSVHVLQEKKTWIWRWWWSHREKADGGWGSKFIWRLFIPQMHIFWLLLEAYGFSVLQEWTDEDFDALWQWHFLNWQHPLNRLSDSFWHLP